ncbi:hypothetical protein LCGC14_1000290 [marine sediment metagenome]|uniref:Uncharacterized protein n=1 Tax=marine sediment metagenome TaxID=412755 RepID=A0A0F9R9C9_9ZZZZ
MNCTSIDCEYCNQEYCSDERRDTDGLEDFEDLEVA